MRRVGSIDVHAIMHKHVLLTIKGTLGIQDIRTATLFVQGINEKLTEVDHYYYYYYYYYYYLIFFKNNGSPSA